MTRRKISPEELAKHNTDDDAWVAIHGFVLNIDKGLKEDHPGGAEVILSLAGKDVSEDFEDIGHSDTAREWAEKCIVGYCEGRDDLACESVKFPRNKDLASLQKNKTDFKLVPIITILALSFAAYLYLK